MPISTHIFEYTAVGPGAAWTLSEDKEDRKWGLWVQGLFEEPKVGVVWWGGVGLVWLGGRGYV
jgi:hypothetical protein